MGQARHGIKAEGSGWRLRWDLVFIFFSSGFGGQIEPTGTYTSLIPGVWWSTEGKRLLDLYGQVRKFSDLCLQLICSRACGGFTFYITFPKLGIARSDEVPFFSGLTIWLSKRTQLVLKVDKILVFRGGNVYWSLSSSVYFKINLQPRTSKFVAGQPDSLHDVSSAPSPWPKYLRYHCPCGCWFVEQEPLIDSVPIQTADSLPCKAFTGNGCFLFADPPRRCLFYWESFIWSAENPKNPTNSIIQEGVC